MLLTAVRSDPGFAHPGVVVGAAQLAFAKAQAAAGVEPFAASLAKARGNTWVNSRAQASMSPGWNGTIACGYFDSHDYGCANATNEAESALLQAYLWAFTGEAVWAQRAAAILNFYGANLKSFAGAGNGPLVAAWATLMWARAAELLAATGAAWAPADAAAFGRALHAACVPALYAGSCDNSNWEHAMIEGLSGVAVFTENRTLFERALAMWAVRVPASVYVSDDGPTHRPGPPACGRYSPFWYSQLVFNASVDGVGQDTCRDFGHMGYSITALFNVAETALLQGVDLYTPNKKRLAATLEFHTALLVAGAAEGWPRDPYHRPALNISRPLVCNGTVLKLAYPATYQVALTGMARLGVALPQTTQYVQRWVWNLSGGDQLGQFMSMYEPLTHGSAYKQW